MENIEKGLLLMTVGMSTVFVILLLVINLGKVLIAVVNKYAPEEVVEKKRPVAKTLSAIPEQTLAAIVSAVSIVTGGKGQVTKIEKQQSNF